MLSQFAPQLKEKGKIKKFVRACIFYILPKNVKKKKLIIIKHLNMLMHFIFSSKKKKIRTFQKFVEFAHVCLFNILPQN